MLQSVSLCERAARQTAETQPVCPPPHTHKKRSGKQTKLESEEEVFEKGSPATFLLCRALWKRRRKEARLKRYMLLIFDRSVMTKYILLALSARGR